MTAQYDWSKLPDGWRYYKHERYGDEFLMSPSGGSYNLIDVRYSSQFPIALAILETCRIPAPEPYVTSGGMHDTCPNCGADLKNKGLHGCIKKPDTATVTALRPADEYDWSRLEGSGWRHPGDSFAHIECDRWAYYYDTGSFTCRAHVIPTDPDEALRAHQEAHALVAKCKRDWRDEVKQACEGHDVKVETYPDYITIGAFLTVYPYKRMSVWAPPDAFGIEHLLRMSLIIERLKKLGWREA